VSRYDWLLFLHLIGAFAALGSVAVYSVLIAGGDRVAGPQLSVLGKRLFDVGGGLTLVFGVWLALDVDGYGIFDGWILGALVLWAVGGWAGGRSGKLFQEDPVGNREAAIRFQAINSAAIILILILMIWKPGA
jgi:uncharacterized membrane protein